MQCEPCNKASVSKTKGRHRYDFNRSSTPACPIEVKCVELMRREQLSEDCEAACEPHANHANHQKPV